MTLHSFALRLSMLMTLIDTSSVTISSPPTGVRPRMCMSRPFTVCSV